MVDSVLDTTKPLSFATFLDEGDPDLGLSTECAAFSKDGVGVLCFDGALGVDSEVVKASS